MAFTAAILPVTSCLQAASFVLGLDNQGPNVVADGLRQTKGRGGSECEVM